MRSNLLILLPLARRQGLRRHCFIGLLLMTVTWLVFAQVVTFEFVVYDDYTYILDSPRVLGGISWNNLKWAFSTGYFSNWHPLTWLSFLFDAQLSGRNPAGYHLTNLVLHTANVLLLYVLLHRMTNAKWQSALVAALFAIHPLHVESVAWISERKGVLSTFFGFFALLCYERYALRLYAKWYALALAALLASLLSKQMLVTLPCVMLLLDYWPLQRYRGDSLPLSVEKPRQRSSRRGKKAACRTVGPAKTPDLLVAGTSPATRYTKCSWKRLVLEKLPFFVLATVFSQIAFAAQKQGGALQSLEAFSFGARVCNAVTAYILYLKDAFWPRALSAFYPHPGEGISLAMAGLASGLLLAVTFVAVWQARRRPYFLVGWLWYLGTLAPVIGLVQIGTQQRADRYTYVPLIGIFMALAWMVPGLLPAGLWRDRLLPRLVIVMVCVLSVVAWGQTRYWRNSIALCERVLAVADPNPVVYRRPTGVVKNDLAINGSASRIQEVKMRPAHAMAHSNLGVAYREMGQLEEAASHLQAALEANPWSGVARANLAKVLHDQKRFDEAIEQFEAALKLNLRMVRAWIDYGNLLHEVGRTEEALDRYATALALDPESALAHYNMGVALADRGRVLEAIRHYREALTIQPSNSQAHNNLGSALDEVGRYEEARHHYQEALRLNPEDARAHNNLGVLLIVHHRDRERALHHFREAVRIDPEFEDARENLKRALSGH